jgi:hypothetical protein
MPLSFLNPGLLFGAAAAALPVILHFLSRRRARKMAFSDLRFLEQAQSRQARSLGVRRWLLLLLRVLALLAVVAGAAGPRWGGLPSTAGGGSYLFVLDASASSQARRGSGTVFGAARDDVVGIVRQLPPGSSVQVIIAGGRTASLFGDWLPAGEAAAAAVATAVPGDGGFDLDAVLREATRQVARAPGAPVDIVLAGDLQGVPAAASWTEAAAALVRARGVRVLLREVTADRGDAGGVVDVQVPRRALRPGEIAPVRATVVPARSGQSFTLELDGHPVAEAVATGPVGRPATLEFALSVPGPGLHAGWVRTESDAMPADDRRPFVLAVPPRLAVLVVHGEDRAGDGAAGRGGWRYLVEALAPGASVGPYAVTVQSSDEITTGAIAASGVVVLVDPGPLGRVAQDALVARLRDGGGVFVLAGDPLVAAPLEASLLPALGQPPVAAPRSAGGEGVHTRVVDPAHPLLAGLDRDALRSITDIGWRHWLRLEPGDSRVVLELTGGDPLLIEREVGEGRLALLAADLRPEADDLARSPMALPLLQRIVSWLGRDAGREGATEALVGQALRVRPRAASSGALADAGELRVDGPGPGTGRAADLAWSGATPWLGCDAVDQAGFVVFRSGADTLGLAAVAVPPAETTGVFEGAGGWRGRLRGLGLEVTADLTGSVGDGFAEVLSGRNLAPWAFLLALLLLAVELWLGRGSGGRADPGS